MTHWPTKKKKGLALMLCKVEPVMTRSTFHISVYLTAYGLPAMEQEDPSWIVMMRVPSTFYTAPCSGLNSIERMAFFSILHIPTLFPFPLA
jgi:hypothetical protein